MKKGIIIGVLFCLCLGAANKPQFWQDVLQVKPTTAWQKLFGYGDVAFLAHGQWKNRQLLDGQGAVIAAMKKEMDAMNARLTALEPVVDPNEVK